MFLSKLEPTSCSTKAELAETEGKGRAAVSRKWQHPGKHDVVREGHTAGPEMQTVTNLWENATEHAPRPPLTSFSTVWWGLLQGETPEDAPLLRLLLGGKNRKSHRTSQSVFCFSSCFLIPPLPPLRFCVFQSAHECTIAYKIIACIISCNQRFMITGPTACVYVCVCNCGDGRHTDSPVQSELSVTPPRRSQSESSPWKRAEQKCVCSNGFFFFSRPILHPADVTGLCARSGA